MNKKILIGLGVGFIVVCIVCAAIAVFIAGKLGDSFDAAEYNNTFANEQIALLDELKALSSSVANVTITEDEAMIKLEEIKVQIDQALDRMEDVKPQGDGGEELKVATIDLFETVKTTLNEDYPRFISLVYNSETDEDEMELMALYDKIVLEMQDKNTKFVEAQKNYAEANNVILEEAN